MINSDTNVATAKMPFAFGTLLINPIAHYFGFLNKNGASFSIVVYFQFLINTFGKT